MCNFGDNLRKVELGVVNYATAPVGNLLITNTCKANNDQDIHNNITNRNHSYIVSNIVHYLWFTNVMRVKGKHGVNFVNYVSIKSLVSEGMA